MLFLIGMIMLIVGLGVVGVVWCMLFFCGYCFSLGSVSDFYELVDMWEVVEYGVVGVCVSFFCFDFLGGVFGWGGVWWSVWDEMWDLV